MAVPMRRVAGVVLGLAILSITARGVGAAEPGLRSLALDLVNGERRARGLAALEVDPALCRAAQDHADDMLSRDYFDHLSPEGEDVMDRYAANGGNRWRGVAENIFKCIRCPEPPNSSGVQKMHREWMRSQDHRETILSPRHNRFCFGLSADPDKGYAAVQTFAGPGGRLGEGSGREPRVQSSKELRGSVLALINQHRRSHERTALEASEALSSDADAFLQAELKRDPEGRDSLSTGRVRDFLSGHDRGAWFKVGVLLEACGGCGAALSDADAARFAESWSRQPEFRATLLGTEFDSFGVAIAADGNGRKVALGLFGDRGD